MFLERSFFDLGRLNSSPSCDRGTTYELYHYFELTTRSPRDRSIKKRQLYPGGFRNAINRTRSVRAGSPRRVALNTVPDDA